MKQMLIVSPTIDYRGTETLLNYVFKCLYENDVAYMAKKSWIGGFLIKTKHVTITVIGLGNLAMASGCIYDEIFGLEKEQGRHFRHNCELSTYEGTWLDYILEAEKEKGE